jgi:hypothetical protein
MRAERQDTDVVRVAAAFGVPGLRYRSFGNRPVRAGTAPAALPAPAIPSAMAPLVEAAPLPAPEAAAGIRPIAAAPPAPAFTGGGRVVPLMRPVAAAAPAPPQPAAMAVEFRLIRQALGGVLPPPPPIQAHWPGPAAEVPGGLPLIATAVAIAAPGLPPPLPAGRPRSTRQAVAALAFAADLD